MRMRRNNLAASRSWLSREDCLVDAASNNLRIRATTGSTGAARSSFLSFPKCYARGPVIPNVRPLCVSMKTRALILEVLLAGACLVFGFAPVSQTRTLQEPTVKSTELPSYPPLARAACVQGSVAVIVEMGQDGQVTGTDILYGHPLLRSAAETAARKWRFEAANDGARREVLRFTFRILPFETPGR